MAALKEKAPLMAIVLDFETGGRDCQKAACTQLSMHMVKLGTMETVSKFVKYFYPYNKKEVKALGKKRVLKSKYDEEEKVPMLYEEDALVYSDISMDLLESKGEPIQDVVDAALQWIEDNTPEGTGKISKPFMIGQNIDFDKGFFCQMLEYTDNVNRAKGLMRGHVDFYGHWQPDTLDTLLLGQVALCNNPDVTSYKLELLCENLGIELDDAHDADADVTATQNVMAVLAGRMRSVEGSSEVVMQKTEKTRKHFVI